MFCLAQYNPVIIILAFNQDQEVNSYVSVIFLCAKSTPAEHVMKLCSLPENHSSRVYELCVDITTALDSAIM